MLCKKELSVSVAGMLGRQIIAGSLVWSRVVQWCVVIGLDGGGISK